MIEPITFPIAFGAGLLSFVSPCVLPLVPVYLATLSGPEILEAKSPRRRLPVFLHSLSFVIGFSLVFVILGAGAGIAGMAIGAHIDTIRQVAGGLLIAFGMFIIASQWVPWLNFQKRFSLPQSMTIGYFRSLLTGATFSLAWTPCVGPVLGGILALALTSDTAWQGAYLLAIYSLGLGLPFLILGIVFDSINPWLKRLQRYIGIIQIASGLILITIGILTLTNKLAWLATI